jgi:DNA polymerase-3 subunit gamma/tau
MPATADAREESSPRPEGGPIAHQPSTPSVAAPVATLFGDRWAEVVRALIEKGAIAALVRELAMQAQCVSIESVSAGDGAPAVWRLCVERETLRSTTHCDKLQAALAALLGGPVRLQVEAGVAQDSPARREAAERAKRQAEAEDIIHNDPVVIALMQQYKTARIVPGSIKAH